MSDAAAATWWYVESGEIRGPVETGRVRELVSSGVLDIDSYLTPVGASDWGTVAGFSTELGYSAPGDDDAPPAPPPTPPDAGAGEPTGESPSTQEPPPTPERPAGTAGGPVVSVGLRPVAGWLLVGAAVLRVLSLLFDYDSATGARGVQDPGILLVGLAVAVVAALAGLGLVTGRRLSSAVGLGLGVGLVSVGAALASTLDLVAGDLDGAGAVLEWISVVLAAGGGFVAGLLARSHGQLGWVPERASLGPRLAAVGALSSVAALAYAFDLFSFTAASSSAQLRRSGFSQGFSPLGDASWATAGVLVEMVVLAALPVVALLLGHRSIRSGLAVAWLVGLASTAFTLLVWTTTDSAFGIDFADSGVDIAWEVAGMVHSAALVVAGVLLAVWVWVRPAADQSPGT